MVKTLNKFGDYTFALNICEVENDPLYSGSRVPGLKFHTEKNWTLPSAVEKPSGESGKTTTLKCYPNPARENVNIEFSLDETGHTSVEIINLGGKVVKSLKNEILSAGPHHIAWSLEGVQENRIPSGIYFCSVISGAQRDYAKIVVE